MIKLAHDTIDSQDISALISWMQEHPTPKLTKGNLTPEFEKSFADYIGSKYAVFCNSGSSAVYLSLLSLKSNFNLTKPKVALCAVCWLTDLSSIILNDMHPILLDCNLNDFSVDLNQLEDCFKKENPEIYLHIHPLGLPNNIEKIKQLCETYNVLFVEDTCESLGTEYKNKKFGSFGDISVFSFYFGHHMSTIEGGMLCTNSENLYNQCLMLRGHGWSRDLNNFEQQKLQNQWGVSDFDNLYTMYELGLNFRNTDLHAFIGLNQLKKLDLFIKQRIELFNYYQKHFEYDFNYAENDWKISLMAYPILSANKEKIFEILSENSIECRPLIAGNIYKHPICKKINVTSFDLKNADLVHKNGLYLPCHHSLTFDDIDKIASLIKKYV